MIASHSDFTVRQLPHQARIANRSILGNLTISHTQSNICVPTTIRLFTTFIHVSKRQIDLDNSFLWEEISNQSLKINEFPSDMGHLREWLRCSAMKLVKHILCP